MYEISILELYFQKYLIFTSVPAPSWQCYASASNLAAIVWDFIHQCLQNTLRLSEGRHYSILNICLICSGQKLFYPVKLKDQKYNWKTAEENTTKIKLKIIKFLPVYLWRRFSVSFPKCMTARATCTSPSRAGVEMRDTCCRQWS